MPVLDAEADIQISGSVQSSGKNRSRDLDCYAWQNGSSLFSKTATCLNDIIILLLFLRCSYWHRTCYSFDSSAHKNLGCSVGQGVK